MAGVFYCEVLPHWEPYGSLKEPYNAQYYKGALPPSSAYLVFFDLLFEDKALDMALEVE